jgi:lipid-A-disaccharide synthase-like uncharacterized protein
MATAWTGMTTVEIIWVAVGFLGQAAFTSRFLVQWLASERKKESVMPVSFWWLSLMGGTVMLAYAVHRGDPVFTVGQASGLVVYARNLMLVRRRPAPADPGVAAEPPAPRPEPIRRPHVSCRPAREETSRPC